MNRQWISVGVERPARRLLLLRPGRLRWAAACTADGDSSQRSAPRAADAPDIPAEPMSFRCSRPAQRRSLCPPLPPKMRWPIADASRRPAAGSHQALYREPDALGRRHCAGRHGDLRRAWRAHACRCSRRRRAHGYRQVRRWGLVCGLQRGRGLWLGPCRAVARLWRRGPGGRRDSAGPCPCCHAAGPGRGARAVLDDLMATFDVRSRWRTQPAAASHNRLGRRRAHMAMLDTDRGPPHWCQSR